MSNNEKLDAINTLKETLLLYALVSQDYNSRPADYGLSKLLDRDIQLHPIEIHLLMAIDAHPGISAQELAQMFFRSKGAISQRVKVLYGYDFITKTVDPNNHRVSLLNTTQSGKIACRVHESFDRARYEKFLDILKDFSTETVETCTQIILLLTQSLYKNCEDSGGRDGAALERPKV